MTTTLNASTAGAGGLIATADASGALAIQTGGTTAIAITSGQAVTIQSLTVGLGNAAAATNTAPPATSAPVPSPVRETESGSPASIAQRTAPIPPQ